MRLCRSKSSLAMDFGWYLSWRHARSSGRCAWCNGSSLVAAPKILGERSTIPADDDVVLVDVPNRKAVCFWLMYCCQIICRSIALYICRRGMTTTHRSLLVVSLHKWQNAKNHRAPGARQHVKARTSSFLVVTSTYRSCVVFINKWVKIGCSWGN